MRKLYLAFFLFISTLIGLGQVGLRKADGLYNRHEFGRALIEYTKIAEKNDSSSYVKVLVADCYLHLNKYKEAETWYRKALTNNPKTFDHHHYLNFAQTLVGNKKYDESIEWFLKYEEIADKDSRVEKKLVAVKNIEHYFKDSLRFEIIPETFNSVSSDHAPRYYKNGIIFSSNRSASKPFEEPKKELPFNIYYATHGVDIPAILPKHLNSSSNEVSPTFSSDGNTIIFSRGDNNFRTASFNNKNISETSLYIVTNEKGKWSKPESFYYNNKSYSIIDPFLSPDDKWLYFSSNMPGGFGGLDIFRVKKLGKNTWGSVQNLGEAVNTEGNERSPFLTSDNVIYFSSDGHGGLGGYDNFKAYPADGLLEELEKKKESSKDTNLTSSVDLSEYDDYPETNYIYGAIYGTDLIIGAEEKKDLFHYSENLGHPLNTNYDDFGLILDDNHKRGYFSSNRNSGLGNDDIYIIKILSEPQLQLKGKITTTNNTPMGQAFVVIRDHLTKETVHTLITNPAGLFDCFLYKGTQYDVVISKNGFATKSQLIDMTNPEIEKLNDLSVSLEKANATNKVLLVEHIIDQHGKGIENAKIILISDDGKSQNFTSKKEGKLSLSLIANKEYTIHLFKNNHFNTCYYFQTPENLNGQKAFFQDLTLPNIEMGGIITLSNIYFSNDYFALTKESQKVLNNVAKFILNHPGIKIEIGSHTDHKGEENHNLTLSEKRAKMCQSYLIAKGVSSNSLTAKGYGESNPLIKCDNSQDCSEEELSKNRRTEFKILHIPNKENNINYKVYERFSNLRQQCQPIGVE